MRKLTMNELHRISKEDFERTEKLPIIIVLDNIRSLSNVGAFFRTADAFRIGELVLCGITACPPHKEISKTALGATESVCWKHFDSTVEAVNDLKAQGYRVWAVEQVDTSVSLEEYAPTKGEKVAIVLGNEVFGVDDEVLALCDGAIEIPQYGTKHSFNVSVAGAIVIWEISKKFSRD